MTEYHHLINTECREQLLGEKEDDKEKITHLQFSKVSRLLDVSQIEITAGQWNILLLRRHICVSLPYPSSSDWKLITLACSFPQFFPLSVSFFFIFWYFSTEARLCQLQTWFFLCSVFFFFRPLGYITINFMSPERCRSWLRWLFLQCNISAAKKKEGQKYTNL